ncbi:hypothetical protein Moror_14461 [Moniliophthora roreri MCA 2997]|uniref:Uncharacterized protein n=2 Tax=Moniliophthora roreri TaxID=221103 RepID=V2WNT7_MONRO|nr:hypothetical protein Moror_14461 [Moniliophthora roreri MCA 2997]KAI3597477.1 hypothetical protein WG66_013232 [Moniliophthora roreri]
MTTQKFVGNQPVDQIPAEAKQQVDLNKLEKKERERLAKGAPEGGSATRAAVASRDPAEYDQRTGGGHGDTKPTQPPVV